MRRPRPVLGRSATGGEKTRPRRLRYWWLYWTAYLFVCCTQLNKLKPQSLSWKDRERERERERESETDNDRAYKLHQFSHNTVCKLTADVITPPTFLSSAVSSLEASRLNIAAYIFSSFPYILHVVPSSSSSIYEAKGTNYDILHYVIMSILLLGLPPPTIKSLWAEHNYAQLLAPELSQCGWCLPFSFQWFIPHCVLLLSICLQSVAYVCLVGVLYFVDNFIMK